MKHLLSFICAILTVVTLLSVAACRSTQSTFESTAESHTSAQASSVQNLLILDSVVRHLQFSADSVSLQITMGIDPSFASGVMQGMPCINPDSQQLPGSSTIHIQPIRDRQNVGSPQSDSPLCSEGLVTLPNVPSLNLHFKAYGLKHTSGLTEVATTDKKCSRSSQVIDDSNRTTTDQRAKSVPRGTRILFLLVGLFVLMAIVDAIIYACKRKSIFLWFWELIRKILP